MSGPAITTRRQHRREQPQRCQDLGPAHDVCHGLDMNRMYGEQQSRPQGPHRQEPRPGDHHNQGSHESVQQHVYDVKPPRSPAGHRPIHGVRDDCHRPVETRRGLVGSRGPVRGKGGIQGRPDRVRRRVVPHYRDVVKRPSVARGIGKHQARDDSGDECRSTMAQSGHRNS